MSTAALENQTTIPLTAVVTPVTGGSYTLSLTCGTITHVDLITDDFDAWPSSVTVTVTSSTLPSGFHIETSGHGSWTAVSNSQLTGTFAGSEPDATFDFTILLYDGQTFITSSDPRLILHKVGAPPRAKIVDPGRPPIP